MLFIDIITYSSAIKSPKILVAYQRPFEWDAKNGQRFAEDMLDVMSGKEKECFLGSMTLLRVPTNDIYLIDGGNREISGLALIALLRNRAINLENKHDRNNEGTKSAYKLVFTAKNNMNDLLYRGSRKQIPLSIPNGTDNESRRFIAYLKGMLIDDGHHHYAAFYNKGKKDSVYRLNSVHRVLSRIIGHKLQDMNYEEQAKYLYTAYHNLCNNVKVARILTTDRRQAQSIYESINSTGVQLAPQDLVKSYLAALLSEDSSEEMKTGMGKFTQMSAVFDDMDTIPYYLSIYCEAKLGMSTSNSSLVNRVDNNISTPSEAKQMIDETLILASTFKELQRPKSVKHLQMPDIAHQNMMLQDMGEHYFYNVILAMHYRKYSKQAIRSVFKVLLKISVQRSLKHNNRPHFNKVSSEIWSNAPSIQTIKAHAIKENRKIQGQLYSSKQMCMSYNEPLTKPGSLRFSTIAFIIANIYRYESNDFKTKDSIYNSLFRSKRNPSFMLMHLSETVDGGLLNSLGNDVLVEASLKPEQIKTLDHKLELLDKSKLKYNRQLYTYVKKALDQGHGITEVVRQRQHHVADDFAKIW